MKKDEYLYVKSEKESKEVIKKHIFRTTTCTSLRDLVQQTLYITRESQMPTWDELEKIVCRMRFQKQEHDIKEEDDNDANE